MLKLWNALEHETRRYGITMNQTTRNVLLIAKLLFWWMYAEGYIDSPARRKSFMTFFGLEEEK